MESTNNQVALELKLLCSQWDQAIVNNDVLEIGKFMSTDWVIIGTEGGITSKQKFLDLVQSKNLLHNRMDFVDCRVMEYGTTGIVTSKGISSGTFNGESFSYYEWSTNIFIKNDGFWRCVLTMVTPAEKES
jgi:ketosteroid isomerase-like protein